jgi:DNA-binding protein H-NS
LGTSLDQTRQEMLDLNQALQESRQSAQLKDMAIKQQEALTNTYLKQIEADQVKLHESAQQLQSCRQDLVKQEALTNQI